MAAREESTAGIPFDGHGPGICIISSLAPAVSQSLQRNKHGDLSSIKKKQDISAEGA